jgi:hypothetical protein
VTHERRTERIAGRNRDGETGGGKQDQKIYTDRRSMCWDGFIFGCNRHGRSKAIWVIGNSQPLHGVGHDGYIASTIGSIATEICKTEYRLGFGELSPEGIEIGQAAI